MAACLLLTLLLTDIEGLHVEFACLLFLSFLLRHFVSFPFFKMVTLCQCVSQL